MDKLNLLQNSCRIKFVLRLICQLLTLKVKTELLISMNKNVQTGKKKKKKQEAEEAACAIYRKLTNGMNPERY